MLKLLLNKPKHVSVNYRKEIFKTSTIADYNFTQSRPRYQAFKSPRGTIAYLQSDAEGAESSNSLKRCGTR